MLIIEMPPDIIDTYHQKKNIRLLRQHILLPSCQKLAGCIPVDACVDNTKLIFRMKCNKRVMHELHISITKFICR